MTKINVYTVESGIPIPDKETRKNFMLGQMKVGDSILVPIKDRASVASSASHARAKTGKEFTTKKTDDGQHVRVWRIA